MGFVNDLDGLYVYWSINFTVFIRLKYLKEKPNNKELLVESFVILESWKKLNDDWLSKYIPADWVKT